MNTWPNNRRRAMTQCEHESWNDRNYPGTRQMCKDCDHPTGNCEEDDLFFNDHGPLCEDCFCQLEEG